MLVCGRVQPLEAVSICLSRTVQSSVPLHDHSWHKLFRDFLELPSLTPSFSCIVFIPDYPF